MHSRTDSSVNPSNVSEPDHHTTMISIPIAYPADKVDHFASNLKQDAQIRSTMSSQGPSTMYPVLVDAVEVVVQHPVPMSSQLPTIVPPDVLTIQPRVPQRNRIQPTQVDTINKRRARCMPISMVMIILQAYYCVKESSRQLYHPELLSK